MVDLHRVDQALDQSHDLSRPQRFVALEVSISLREENALSMVSAVKSLVRFTLQMQCAFACLEQEAVS